MPVTSLLLIAEQTKKQAHAAGTVSQCGDVEEDKVRVKTDNENIVAESDITYCCL